MTAVSPIDDARAVVDEEAAADFRAWMNVDASLRMREFGDDASDDRRAERMQRVRDTVMDDGPNAGKAQKYLLGAFRRRIAIVGGADIAFERFVELRQVGCKFRDDLLWREGGIVLGTRLVDKGVLSPDLLNQYVERLIERVADEEGETLIAVVDCTRVAWK